MRRLTLPDSAAAGEGAIRHAPSAARNLEPIAAILAQYLPASGRVLELASGTGQHICAFAERFPALEWQPSDIDKAALASIAARIAHAPRANLAAPVALDACRPGWAAANGPFNAVCLSNLLHLISAPEAETLLAEAASALAPGGRFCLYGPFRRGGELVTEGDRAFDASLRAQDKAIGYKDIDDIAATLLRFGAVEIARPEMPAGNLMLIAERPIQA
ncbi:MAG: DUF938 domain-containing protein [Pararhodobacter sp.]|nr:DUF938 domain-containing protein [Pararhodobacter sp.]